jgi:hypothetical protein
LADLADLVLVFTTVCWAWAVGLENRKAARREAAKNDLYMRVGEEIECSVSGVGELRLLFRRYKISIAP